MKKILGISAYFHDAAASLIIGGEIIAAAQEERFTRIKHTSDFPENAVKYCLQEAGIDFSDLDAVVFYDKPLLKFERLLQSYYAFAPKGVFSFLKSIPVWMKEKLFLKKILRDRLAEMGNYDSKRTPLLFSEHHLSHAASAFYPSPFDEAAILTIDGVGEWATASISYGNKTDIKMLREMRFPHSVGLLYSAFTYYLGFAVNSGEYKVMGLAPYGDMYSEETVRFIDIIKTRLIDIKEDGSIWLNQSYFNYVTGLRMVKDSKWEKLFGISRRSPETEINQTYCNLALAIQKVTEEIVVKMANEARRITGSDNLCMAGGVALNCVVNGILEKANIFKHIFIQPASGDAGCALGSAFAVSMLYFNEARIVLKGMDAMKGSYLGPSYSDKEVDGMNRKYDAVSIFYNDFSELSSLVASRIGEGNVVGWFQGRMEFGPRALGNRSILADPRNPDMQKKLNLKIKKREGFRPFAPAVLSEMVSDYFDLDFQSPYMLFVAPVVLKRRKSIPQGYNQMGLMEKLYWNRSDIPAVTHLDYSARVQAVSSATNPRFHELIKAFEKNTGCAVLVNTSFNVRGEPVVCTPQDAYRCFMNTDMDFLVIGNYLYAKKDQPEWDNQKKWKMKFKMD